MAFVQALYNNANEVVGVLGTDYDFGENNLEYFIQASLPSQESQLAIVQDRGDLANQSQRADVSWSR